MNRILPSITLDGRKLQILPGVYKPLDNEHRLVEGLDPGKTVLDVGCGSGVIALFASLKSKHVTALDIGPQSIKNTILNCKNHRIENVTALQSDMYEAAEGRFDYIISYPPLFEGNFSSDDNQWCTSTDFVSKLFSGALEHLNPDGRLIVLLPEKFRLNPISLGEQHGLKLESKVRHKYQTFSNRLHCIPYFHFEANNHLFTFKAAQSLN